MDETKREELEGAYKKEKNQRVAARMLAVHMARVLGESAGETAAVLCGPASGCTAGWNATMPRA